MASNPPPDRARTPAAIVCGLSIGLCALVGLGYAVLGLVYVTGGESLGWALVAVLPVSLVGPAIQVLLLRRRWHAAAVVVAVISALLAIVGVSLVGAIIFGFANP